MGILEHLTSNNQRRVEILRYVLERQTANQKTTKATVIKHMKEIKLSSGETTHNLIRDLINEGKLNVRELNSQVHFLTVSEKFDFNKMLTESLKASIEESLKPFENILRNTRINLRITNESMGKYSTYVSASGAKEIEQMDIVVTKEHALRELEKRLKKTSIKKQEKSKQSLE